MVEKLTISYGPYHMVHIIWSIILYIHSHLMVFIKDNSNVHIFSS